jgi:membrane-associated protease RseP (regulator of RpoE activity)
VSETTDQSAVSEPVAPEPVAPETATATPAPDAPAPAQVTQQYYAPQPPSSHRLGTGWRWGISAAILVVVAAAFFTIGWFASGGGDHERFAAMRGYQQMNMRQWGDQQGPDQWQGHPGRRGMQQTPTTQATPQETPQQTPTTQQEPSTPQSPSTPQTPSANQGYLGLGLQTVTAQVQQQYGLSRSSGALVVTLDSTAPGPQAGIRQGDVITGIDGTAITKSEDAVALVRAKKAGDSVSITIDRNGQTLTIQVTLASRAVTG